MLTLRNIFDVALFDLGVENADHAPAPVRVAVLGYITAGLQTMQAAGEDYYSKEEETVPLVAGTASYAMGKTVQTVLDSPRIGARHLMKLSSRQRYDNFGPLFMGQLGTTVADGTPLAYWVETLRDTTADEEDNVKVRIYLAPGPSANGSMIVPVINEPPTYELADLCDDTVIPPVPHKYHETILLPIVRMNATSHPYFDRNKARFPRIQADYIAALKMLGLADPRRQPQGAAAAEKTSQEQPEAAQ